jgi:Zn-dependent oligopeptidase
MIPQGMMKCKEHPYPYPKTSKHQSTGFQCHQNLERMAAGATVMVCSGCRSGSMMMRQLHFAMLDLELHARFKPGGKETVFDVDHRIAEKTMVMKPLPEDR